MQTWVPKFQLQVLELSSTTESNSIPLPNFLHYQYNLTYLDFTGCRGGGEFPNWLLENNTKMSDLLLKNCSFTGGFQMPSRPHLELTRLDVSHNAITGQMPSSNISYIFPNLESLDMSLNAIHGPIPHELCRMSTLNTLDLLNNQLSGEIPFNIYGVKKQLESLALSNNMLDGPILPMLSNLAYLSLEGNSLSGSIPNSFFLTHATISFIWK
jgi:Leucine-rich repeat (LRR) protein